MGLFEKLPYTNFHRVNLNWIIKKLQIMDTKLDELVSDHDAVVDLQSRMTTAEGNITSLSGRMTTAETKLGKIPLPAVGDVGKVLGAVADGAGAKLSYVTDQTGGDVPTPAAGDNGKVLTAGSGGTYSWETASGSNVPTPGSGDSGKVLTAGSGGSMSWQTVSGGAGTIIRDSYNTYGHVFVDAVLNTTMYPVISTIYADMTAARSVSLSAMLDVYMRVKIYKNGRSLPIDNVGINLGSYTTSSEEFAYLDTGEAQTVSVSGTMKRVQ